MWGNLMMKGGYGQTNQLCTVYMMYQCSTADAMIEGLPQLDDIIFLVILFLNVYQAGQTRLNLIAKHVLQYCG